MNQAHIPGSVSRSTIGVAVRIVLAVAAIGFVATQVDISVIRETGSKADASWIILAVLLLPVNLGLEALTWFPLLHRVTGGTRRSEAFLAVVSGYPLGMFTPARVGELAGRALFIQRGDRATIAISAAVARLADFVVVLAAGTAALFTGMLTGYLQFDGAFALLGLSLAATVVSAIVVLAPGLIARFADRLHVLRRFHVQIAFLADLPVGVMIRVLFFSAVRLCVYSGQFVLLAFGFSQALHLGLAWMAVLLTLLAKSIIPPVTYLDLGIREGAAAFFFGHLGLGSAIGFSSALMLFLINLALPALLGSPLIYRYRLFASTADQVKAAPSEEDIG